jgi:hypothetical protein
MDSEWDVYRSFRVTIHTVAAGCQQFSLAEGFKKNCFPAVGMYKGHISRVGNSQEFPAIVGVAYRGVWGQIMKGAFQFVFIVFDINLSVHAHNFLLWNL